ncbi:MAG: protein-S-isoprenylcysteine methyltransferase [Sphingomonadales bacterium]|nr:protein-S-isoprenylcysteine methyltransferase [Sphingomonadales bacterium]MBD3774943.1 protein-S-isoprenylcysteine methyltransferase [Paracoccaceae bacterium]
MDALTNSITPTRAQDRSAPPPSDVSAGVGLSGLFGLFVWIAFCREYPLIADALALPGPHAVLSGPHASLTAMVFTVLPMVAWSLLVDKVHRRPTTGIAWDAPRKWGEQWRVSATKIVGLWATWAIIGALYAMCRWYWEGQFLFAMEVIGWAIIPMVVLSVPYVLWIDRVMVNPRDHAWHFGAMLLGREAYDPAEVKKHWRAWIIKAFFGAFMISILPGGFQAVVEADFAKIHSDPIQLGWLLINLLFLIDVQIGTVGYLVTLRPLDAHIRSGNPFVAGWLAALLCYPPFVWGVIGNGEVLSYEHNVADWGIWMQGQPLMLWLWAGLLVALTGMYAWATLAFGIRFSNLTYRGVLTNGPYRFTRHPAYLSKNLFWWCSTMPFLVTNGSAGDAIRNSFFLLCVNGIYYWRAKTEEAHLLAEDGKYREYHAWMEQHGLFTRPLAALKRRLRPRGPVVMQPAE